MASSSRVRLLGRLKVGMAMTTRSTMTGLQIAHQAVHFQYDEDCASQNATQRRDRAQGEQKGKREQNGDQAGVNADPHQSFELPGRLHESRWRGAEAAHQHD